MPDALAAALAQPGLGWLICATFVAGMVRGFTGFGTALIFMPVAAQHLDPVWAVLTMVVMELFGPLPNLPGPHQIMNAGAAIAALRAMGKDEAACETAVTRAYWPARMEKLTKGVLVDLASPAERTAEEARKVGLSASEAASVQEAIKAITAAHPNARILICGSLYLAGHVMRENSA